MLLVHVLHGSPEMVGDADSICNLRAGISIGIILGATSLLAVWGSDDLFVRGLVSLSTGIVDASSIGQVSWWLPCWNYGAC